MLIWMVSSTLLWVNHGGLGRPDHVFELTRWSLIALNQCRRDEYLH